MNTTNTTEFHIQWTTLYGRYAQASGPDAPEARKSVFDAQELFTARKWVAQEGEGLGPDWAEFMLQLGHGWLIEEGLLEGEAARRAQFLLRTLQVHSDGHMMTELDALVTRFYQGTSPRAPSSVRLTVEPMDGFATGNYWIKDGNKPLAVFKTGTYRSIAETVRQLAFSMGLGPVIAPSIPVVLPRVQVLADPEADSTERPCVGSNLWAGPTSQVKYYGKIPAGTLEDSDQVDAQSEHSEDSESDSLAKPSKTVETSCPEEGWEFEGDAVSTSSAAASEEESQSEGSQSTDGISSWGSSASRTCTRPSKSAPTLPVDETEGGWEFEAVEGDDVESEETSGEEGTSSPRSSSEAHESSSGEGTSSASLYTGPMMGVIQPFIEQDGAWLAEMRALAGRVRNRNAEGEEEEVYKKAKEASVQQFARLCIVLNAASVGDVKEEDIFQGKDRVWVALDVEESFNLPVTKNVDDPDAGDPPPPAACNYLAGMRVFGDSKEDRLAGVKFRVDDELMRIVEEINLVEIRQALARPVIQMPDGQAERLVQQLKTSGRTGHQEEMFVDARGFEGSVEVREEEPTGRRQVSWSEIVRDGKTLSEDQVAQVLVRIDRLQQLLIESDEVTCDQIYAQMCPEGRAHLLSYLAANHEGHLSSMQQKYGSRVTRLTSLSATVGLSPSPFRLTEAAQQAIGRGVSFDRLLASSPLDLLLTPSSARTPTPNTTPSSSCDKEGSSERSLFETSTNPRASAPCLDVSNSRGGAASPLATPLGLTIGSTGVQQQGAQ
ncbi:MAG: hypothetical protein ACOYKZ_07970 [Chlamydiia bacterium]